ncbi:MAG: HAD family phosphatase [Bryobacteraceae bacterium]|nr:HAD family phosphatase [Bryobacteraceae bacterium]
MQHYEALLFDFDGVLVDSEPIHWRCWQDIIAPYGYSVTWEEYAPACVGVHERGTVEWLRRQRRPPVPFEELWAQYPRKKLMYLERMMQAGMRADVIHMIRMLSNDYLLAVVTSSARTEVEPVLEAAGLLKYLQTIVYGGDVRNLKPSPDPYLLAVERIGTSNALVVEDSAAGIASAKAADLDVLVIPDQSAMSALVLTRLNLVPPTSARRSDVYRL